MEAGNLLSFAGVAIVMAAPAFAQITLTTLAEPASVLSPGGSLVLSGNTLYGTNLYDEADDGSVFSLPVTGEGGSVTGLASFNGSNGDYPRGGLTLSGNTLYGTTEYGGVSGLGSVFAVPVTGGSPTVLALFNGLNGDMPLSGVTLSGNTLYGTTYHGGAYGGTSGGYGTVFSVPVTGGTPTVLASFDVSNGEYPQGGLTLLGNTLYGTTQFGGANNEGTVFSVPVTGGSPTVIKSFNGSNGGWPVAGLTLLGNTLYGTTAFGGNGFNGSYGSGNGTVFSVPATGGSPTDLVSFNSTDGSVPLAGLTLSGNTLYGTTEYGVMDSDGTVFSVLIDSGSFSDLVSFDSYDGESPNAGVTLSGNILYGTTSQGFYGYPSVFALSIPEPATESLLLVASAGILLRRGRPTA
jgi:uncharacterized repeat protein (TIGR03803 family)